MPLFCPFSVGLSCFGWAALYFARVGVLRLWCVFVRAVVVSALCGASGALLCGCGRLPWFRFRFSGLVWQSCRRLRILCPFWLHLWPAVGFYYALRVFLHPWRLLSSFGRSLRCVGCWQWFRFWFSRCGFGCFAAFGRGCSVKFCPAAVPGLGYNMPVVFFGFLFGSFAASSVFIVQ